MSEEKGEKMTKSTFIVNGKTLEIKTINYNRGNLDIITTNNYLLNIDFNFDITELKEGSRENISGKIYKDQNFSTDKYSYVIYIGQDVYLTKNKNKYYLEINLPKVDILIPPFDKSKNKRLEEDKYSSEIKQLEVKVYFSN